MSSWYCNIRWRSHLPGPRRQGALALAGDILVIKHLAMDMSMITFERVALCISCESGHKLNGLRHLGIRMP
jgi:hypothetical protein